MTRLKVPRLTHQAAIQQHPEVAKARVPNLQEKGLLRLARSTCARWGLKVIFEWSLPRRGLRAQIHEVPGANGCHASGLTTIEHNGVLGC